MSRLFKPRELCVAISPDFEVLYAGWVEPPAGMVAGKYTLLTGCMAEYLYIALTGHRFEHHPTTGTTERAMTMRTFIAELAALNRPFAGVAQRAIERRGRIIEPGLGMVELTETGQIIV